MLFVYHLNGMLNLLNSQPLWLRLLIAALATWRLSSLLVNPNESGPGKILHRLRDWAGVYELGDDDEPLMNLGRLFACVWCMSVWVSVALAVLAISPLWVVEIPLALSAVAILIQSVVIK